MKVSGFSYIRNGLELGYPFLQSIQSVLPLCNEFIIAVGDSNDGTREAIEQLNEPKIKIIDTVWDVHLRENGKIFSQQANIALDQITGHWGLHIQADEVLHERDIPLIEAALEQYEQDPRVEGFIQPFHHFWGNYDHIRTSRRVHRYEIRIFKNEKCIRSYKDSQGFRRFSSIEAYEKGENGKKLWVKKLNAPVYHYNAVRNRAQMLKKVFEFDSRYNANVQGTEERYVNFKYENIDRVEKFAGSHPQVMKERISTQNQPFDFDPRQAKWRLKDRILQPIEDWLGVRFGEYKNYRLLR